MKMHEVTIMDTSEDDSNAFNYIVGCKCGYTALVLTKKTAKEKEMEHLTVHQNLN